jgi:hypothetical protein
LASADTNSVIPEFRSEFPGTDIERQTFKCENQKIQRKTTMKHINTLIRTSIGQPKTELLITPARTSIFALAFVAFALAGFALSPGAQAVSPAPGGGYPNFNTAEGDDALFSLTTGGLSTAIGFNALYSNTTGGHNTAAGTQALVSNTTGNFSTAIGTSCAL